MRLVDSSAWIEVLSDSMIGRDVRGEFPARTECLVPTIVQFELAKWFRREGRSRETREMIAFTGKCTVVDLDTEIAAKAASMWEKYRLATADAIIYATALICGADLLTCDKHFEGLPGVVYVAKPAHPHH